MLLTDEHKECCVELAERPLTLSVTINECRQRWLTLTARTGEGYLCGDLQVYVDEVQENARRYNSLYELIFVVDVVAGGPVAPNAVAAVQFPWGSEHYLGPVTRNAEEMPSARLVPHVPQQLRLIVRVDACVSPDVLPPWPCEMLLKEHVKTILENEEYCGSLPSAHVQNLVRDMPFYTPGLRRFERWPNFIAFFAEHYHSWSYATYTKERHEELRLSFLTPPVEKRIVANRFAHTYELGDFGRDRAKLCALRKFRRAITASLTCDPPTPGLPAHSCGAPFHDPWFIEISRTRCFVTLNTVNFLQTLKDASSQYAVLFSPLHPVQLDIRSSSATFSDSFIFGGEKSSAAKRTEALVS